MRSSHALRFVGFAVTACVLATLTVCLALVLAPVQRCHAVTAAEAMAEAQAAYAALTETQEKLNVSEQEYDGAIMEMQNAEKKIQEATERMKVLKVGLASMIRSEYTNDKIGILDVLFNSSSFTDLATNLALMAKLQKSNSDLIDEMKALRTELTEQKAIAENNAKIAAEEMAEATELMQIQRATYDSLSEQAAVLLAQEIMANQTANYEYMAATYGDGSWGGYTGTWDYAGGGGDILDRAYALLGSRYVYGGSSPDGFDCSGYVGYVLTGSTARIGNTLTYMQWPQLSEPEVGCVCVSNGHTGIYVGNGQMIHAMNEENGVCVSAVDPDMIFVQSPY